MAFIDLKNEKRINVNGGWDKVTTHLNNEPIFRQNGHELVFDSANSDYLGLPFVLSNQGDSFSITASIDNSASTGNYGTQNGGEDNNLLALSNGQFLLRTKNNTDNVSSAANVILPNKKNVITVKKGSNNKIQLYVNNVFIGETVTEGNFTIDTIMRRGSAYSSGTVHAITLNNETFNPTNINNNAQIVGSSGTVATVNTSHASGNSYILGTVFQKSSFALVGNGTTQKIVGHLGTELTLTSTPLEGGFTLDGVIYNLTEGLGNEIKSTTGETATIQGYTGTGLNFGGWQKGNSIDGWNPYTIV